jgi:uncharacterized protein YqjF (DUF2071 family)
MRQHWRDLLFAHWQVDPAVIQQHLPRCLRVDTWQGKAFLASCRFAWRRCASVDCRPCPDSLSCWNSTCARMSSTRRESGGVWFYTLDANHATAVAIARICFHLPYHRAHPASQPRP